MYVRLWTIGLSLLAVGLIALAYWFARPSDESVAADLSDGQNPVTRSDDTQTQTSGHVQSIGRSSAESLTANVSLRPSNRPIQVNGHGFVSSSACKDCHPNQYASWHASYHRKMTQVASEESVIGDFDSKLVRAYGLDFALTKQGDEYWVSMPDLEAEDLQQADRVQQKIVMTTGSHHMQIYWYSADEGRTLSQLPVAWLKETQSWVPTSALFISPPPQPLRVGKRRWNEVCIKCHTTNGQPRIHHNDGANGGDLQVDTHVAEFGISCEACHGPGESHVAAHSESAPAATDSIVHPAKLDHVRASQACGQCHGNWLPDNQEDLDAYYVKGTCFRAGEDLSDSRHIFASEDDRSPFIESFLQQQPHYFEDRYWGDGAIRVSGGEYNGMSGSNCFKSSDLSCLSCHQMHHADGDGRPVDEWANHQLGGERLGQEACLQCHEEFRDADRLTSHTHHTASSSGSDCYNCHMPHTSYGLLKAIRSHRITSPSVQESVRYGRPNACNQCHIDQTLAWTGEHLQAWYRIEPAPNLTVDQKRYSATALWCLTGDAGQRALAAWTLGWQPAKEASRTDWVPAVLAQLLADPYAAVRHISHRSLKTLPQFGAFEFDYTADRAANQQGAVRAFKVWQRTPKQTGDNETVLLTRDGNLASQEFTRLNRSRDNRQVLLAE